MAYLRLAAVQSNDIGQGGFPEERLTREGGSAQQSGITTSGGNPLNDISERPNSCHINQLPVRRGNRPLPYCKTKWALRFNFRVDSSWPVAKGRSFP